MAATREMKIGVTGALFLLVFFVVLSMNPCLAGEKEGEKPEDWERRLEMLRSVPYLSYSQEEADSQQSDVVLHIPDKVCNGYNFYSDENSQEAFLIDMSGQVVHRWEFPPDPEGAPGDDQAFLLDNGDVVVIRANEKLLRVGWNSEVQWQMDLRAHHEVAPAPDGTLYTLISEGLIYRGLRVDFCAIVHVTAGGTEIERWSTLKNLDHLKESLDTRLFLDTLLDSLQRGRSSGDHVLDEVKMAAGPGHHRYDYFHMNTVNVLSHSAAQRGDRRFRSGNLLVCFRNIDQIAVMDKETYRVLWAWGAGQLERPHHPTMLENGHILIFDNGIRRKFSRVVELDPVSEEIVWEYVADPRPSFYSFGEGSAQRLSNGNTLICESAKGRVFEVTEDGQVVWVWLNPAVKGRQRETVYRMIRWTEEVVEPLLRK